METLNAILPQELKLTEAAIAKNTKSYYAWYHRKWCIEHLTELPSSPTLLSGTTVEPILPSLLSSSSSTEVPSSTQDSETTVTPKPVPTPVSSIFNAQNEVLLCNKLLDLDERNFHCWQYRRWITERCRIPIDIELQYTLERIQKNFSNYSAWHQRSYLLQKKYTVSTPVSSSSSSSTISLIPLSFLSAELDLLRQAMFTEPDDQSPWFYHRWIIYEICKRLSTVDWCNNQDTFESISKEIYTLLMNDCSHLRSLQDIESRSKWPLIALIHSSQLWYRTFDKALSLSSNTVQQSSVITFPSSPSGILTLSEIQKYLTQVESMDQLHIDYYEHLR